MGSVQVSPRRLLAGAAVIWDFPLFSHVQVHVKRVTGHVWVMYVYAEYLMWTECKEIKNGNIYVCVTHIHTQTREKDRPAVPQAGSGGSYGRHVL